MKKKKEEKKEQTLNELIINEAVKQYKEGNIRNALDILLLLQVLYLCSSKQV